MIRLKLLALLLAAAGCTALPAEAPPSRSYAAGAELPPARRFPPALPAPPARSNADIARDFLDLHFKLEGGAELPVFTRFEAPVRVRVTGAPPAGMIADLDTLLARLRSEAGIPVTRTGSAAAEITIQAVSRDAIRRALPKAACFVVPNVSSLGEYRRNRRSPRASWTALRSREKLAIFVPNDTSPQDVRDCLHEELAQALGPLNDLYRLPDSIFNDDNAHVVLTGFDMLVLRAAYAPELATGMTRAEVSARLPAILARLNPAGERRPPAPLPATPKSWVTAVETALVPGIPQPSRLRAANRAAEIARDLGWQDHRRAFAHYTLGRMLQHDSAEAAQAHFRTALRYLQNQPSTGPHRARVYARLAGLEAAQGNAQAALDLIRPGLPLAKEAQNAALLASLKLLEADALALAGRIAEARAVRLDSLGWARYGFGPEWAERARQQELASLARSETQANKR